MILVCINAGVRAIFRAVNWSDHAEAALKSSGYRSGGARRAVVELLARQDCCMSAREIVDDLRGEGRDVAPASVYRALDVLTELGLVQRLEMGEGLARFEAAQPSGEHHHHLVCDSCGNVSAFEDPELEQAIERASHRVAFAVDQHDIVLRGACPDCRSN
jgi:Fur family ferric uptake transcriptional regulator